jgi:hypothetical protein
MSTMLMLAVFLAAAPMAAERPTDKDVEQLLERVNSDRDRFEDQLDGRLKREILRGPTGEVDVDRFLNDLQDGLNRWRDRFSADYAASAEATTVLRQASAIHRFMSTQPATLQGMSEWERLAASLGQLAAVYGATFPLGEQASARRMNDREVQRAANAVAEAADQFKKEIGIALRNDKTVDKPARDQALKEVDTLKNAARTVAARLGGGQPATAHAKALLDAVGTVAASSARRGVTPSAEAAWSSLTSALEKVSASFGLPLPGALIFRQLGAEATGAASLASTTARRAPPRRQASS